MLLGATAEGLATAPISEAVEVAWPRQLLARMLSGLADSDTGQAHARELLAVAGQDGGGQDGGGQDGGGQA